MAKVATPVSASNSKGAPTGAVAGSASGKGTQPRGHTPTRSHAGKASAPKVMPSHAKAAGMPGHGGSENQKKVPPQPVGAEMSKDASPFSKFHNKTADVVHRAAREDETQAGPQHYSYPT